ncbi:HAD-IA family hydrolase [Luteococcus peritonei]|uniref:HAD-IA family hydrolase n=1 Tax=Luteococcus peritonei TaxID=88874 RepID=A0ABW4RUX3_9ACTN
MTNSAKPFATAARPEAVLWDFDSTLVDTEPIWMRCEVQTAQHFGLEWSEADSQAIVGMSVWGLADLMAERLGRPEVSADDVREDLERRAVAAMADEGEKLFLPGAHELLTEMREQGVRTALVSSTPRYIIDAILANLPELGFAAIVGGDEVSQNKPAPDGYLKAAELLGVDAANCLVLEDSPTGADAGQASGAVVVAIPSTIPVPEARRRVVIDSLDGVTCTLLFQLYRRSIGRPAKMVAPPTPPTENFSGVRTGPLQPGERVTLSDQKGRRHSIQLTPGKAFHSSKGGFLHDELIGRPEGVTVEAGGMTFLALRPLMSDYTVAMPREAAVIYPKDAAQILMWGDIFPGARVLEAGVGSGALSIALLRAIGPAGSLHSYERRQEFADVARTNVENFLGMAHPGWTLTVGDLVENIADEPIDRAVLDMLAPWECVDAVGEVLQPGGVLTCYVATATQLGRVADTLRVHGGFTEPQATETTMRDWHAEGLAIRPGHGSTGHTGFLVHSRRLAPGITAPMRKRRPAPGAYGPDYHGPRPANIPMSNQDVPEDAPQEQED